MHIGHRRIAETLVENPVRRDFVFLLVDRGFRLVVGLVLGGLVARHLGVEAYGWLSYAGTVMAIGAAVAQLGLDSIVVREAARNPEGVDQIIGAALALRAIAGCVMVIVVWCCAWLTESDNPVQRLLVTILALGSFVPMLGVPTLWFQARTESWLAVRAAFGGFVGGAVLRWWLLVDGASVVAFAWASLAEAGITGALIAVAMFKRHGRFHFGGVRQRGFTLLRDAWPLLVGALAAIVYMRIDQIMINWLVGARAVGIYSAATRLSEAAYLVPLLMGTSMMAALTTAYDYGDRFDTMVDRYFRSSAAVGYALAIPTILLAPWLLRFLFGEEFSETGNVARIHLISVIFVAMSVARGRVLVVRGLVRFGMATAITGGVVNIALNVLLIPIWGPLGAAVSAVVAHGMAAVGSTLLYPPTRQLGWHQLRALTRPSLFLWGSQRTDEVDTPRNS